MKGEHPPTPQGLSVTPPRPVPALPLRQPNHQVQRDLHRQRGAAAAQPDLLGGPRGPVTVGLGGEGTPLWVPPSRQVLSPPSNPLAAGRKPTEVEWRYTEEGERVRVSLRSGRIIPLPLRQRRDGIVPEQWIGEWGFGGGGRTWGGLPDPSWGNASPLRGSALSLRLRRRPQGHIGG